MTTPAEVAPSPERVKVICVCCTAEAHIWITAEEIAAMGFKWLPLDFAYSHVCGKCLYQTTTSDVPIPHLPHTAGPDRAEAKRTSGGYHRVEWRAR